MSNLNELRTKINEIDKNIARLLEERMNVVRGVIEYKKENNMPILDQGREQDVINNVLSNLNNKEIEPFIKEVYASIMKVSKDYQSEL